MITIADSDAFKDSGRVLPQHQAAITLLQGFVSAPNVRRIRWLDLACGQGQIIASLDIHLSEDARRKVEYWAYDASLRFARETTRSAERMGFGAVKTRVGDLSDFHRVLPSPLRFDYVTLTSVIHELEPARLPDLFMNCIERLNPTATLFIYDVETVDPPELGALPWGCNDIRRVVHRMLDALGTSTYRPEVGRWAHKSCYGWSVQIQRSHIGLSDSAICANRDAAVAAGGNEIRRILSKRLSECECSLETLTRYGAETREEESATTRLLYEFWALHRARRDPA